MRARLAGMLVLIWTAAVRAEAPEAVIHIDAAKKTGRVSRYWTGACIEDVNHEIYGGRVDLSARAIPVIPWSE